MSYITTIGPSFVTVKTLDAVSASIANSDTIVFQKAFSAGALRAGCRLRLAMTITKSGTTDTAAVKIYMGTAGTTADDQIFASTAAIVTGNRSSGWIVDFRIESATSIQRLVNGNTGASFGYSIGASPTAAGAVTISNVSNALFFSVGIASSSTNDTVALLDAQLQLHYPVA